MYEPSGFPGVPSRPAPFECARDGSRSVLTIDADALAIRPEYTLEGQARYTLTDFERDLLADALLTVMGEDALTGLLGRIAVVLGERRPS